MFSVPKEIIENVLNQYRGQGAPQLPIPATRTFGGFLGSQGQLMPMGLFSQQASQLSQFPRLSQFVDPGPAYGPRMPSFPPEWMGGILGPTRRPY